MADYRIGDTKKISKDLYLFKEEDMAIAGDKGQTEFESHLEEIEKDKNKILVSKTVSKIRGAGIIRSGYAIIRIKYWEKIKIPLNKD